MRRAGYPVKKDPQWTVVIPYFDEEDFLPTTLESLKRQSLKDFKLILVNNGSTDRSEEICRDLMTNVRKIDTQFVDEPNPGQVHALQAGIALVDTEYVAICDADTFYPRNYLKKANKLFETSSRAIVAVIAVSVKGDGNSLSGEFQRAKTALVARVLRGQAHAGGHAHCFKTDVLRLAGGYSKELWPYVLKDHELMNRIFKFGRSRYSYDFWCSTSERREDRLNVRWTLSERLLYHVTPYALKDWFFYSFLKRRFEGRQLNELKLRDRSWEKKE